MWAELVCGQGLEVESWWHPEVAEAPRVGRAGAGRASLEIRGNEAGSHACRVAVVDVDPWV